MIALPPLPSWQGLHPLIIHFPIVLLLIAPVLIAIGVLIPIQKGRILLYTALGVMAFGTLSTFIAAASGDAASELVNKTPQIKVVLEQHEELAEMTRGVFTFLTIIFAAIVLAPIIFSRFSGRISSTVLPSVFLMLYGVGMVLLVNTAHNGGRLVHEFGVRAVVSPSAAVQPGGPAGATAGEED